MGHGPERRNTTSLGDPVQDKGASGRRGTLAGSSGGLFCCDLRTPLGPPALAPAPDPSTDEGRTLHSDGRSWAQAHTESLLVSSGDIKGLLAYAVAVLQPQRMKFLTNTWGRVQGQGLLGCWEGRGGQGRCKSAPTWPQAAPGLQPSVYPQEHEPWRQKKTAKTQTPRHRDLPTRQWGELCQGQLSRCKENCPVGGSWEATGL